MELRRMGRTGLKVAPICFGGNVLGWTTDEPTSFAVLDAYVEAGGNFIDTADTYQRWVPGHRGGESETILGKWMAARGNRAQLIVATKLGQAMGESPNERGLSRAHIMNSIENSLRRLQTDYIDLYQAHIDDRDTPLEESLRAFDDLQRQGKIRYLGASNYTAWRLATALGVSERHGFARYETLQPRYNLAARDDYERELEPLCQEQGVGVITYSSLASGFFSGKYRAGRDLPATPRAQGVQRGYMNDKGFAILDVVERVAREHGATPGQVALAWILARPAVVAPIASATTAEQARELIGAAEVRLDPEALALLDAASAWR